jgi:hypothetical protein
VEDSIIAQALSAVAIIKVLVDLLKLAWLKVPQWVPPTVALLGGPAVVALFQVAAGQPLTQQLLAQAILAGILAGGGAIGTTELSNRAQAPKMKIGQ